MNVERRIYQGKLERLFTTLASISLLACSLSLTWKTSWNLSWTTNPQDQLKRSRILLMMPTASVAYIMFTHFDKATDDGCISDKFAFTALTRNMATSPAERGWSSWTIHFGKENWLSRNIKDNDNAMGYNHSHIDVDKMKFFYRWNQASQLNRKNLCGVTFLHLVGISCQIIVTVGREQSFLTHRSQSEVGCFFFFSFASFRRGSWSERGYLLWYRLKRYRCFSNNLHIKLPNGFEICT